MEHGPRYDDISNKRVYQHLCNMNNEDNIIAI